MLRFLVGEKRFARKLRGALERRQRREIPDALKVGMAVGCARRRPALRSPRLCGRRGRLTGERRHGHHHQHSDESRDSVLHVPASHLFALTWRQDTSDDSWSTSRKCPRRRQESIGVLRIHACAHHPLDASSARGVITRRLPDSFFGALRRVDRLHRVPGQPEQPSAWQTC